MPRAKTQHMLIADPRVRKVTFEKRMKGLTKKLSDLSTLCGVDACAIIYSPYNKQPDVWPSLPEAQLLAARFQSLPEMEKGKKMTNQEGFLRQRISKLQEQLKRQEKENRETEINHLMYQCLAGSRSLGDVNNIVDLKDLEALIGEKMNLIEERIGYLRRPSPPLMVIDEGGDDQAEIAVPCSLGMSMPQPSFMEMEVINNNPSGNQFTGFCGNGMMLTCGETTTWSNHHFDGAFWGN
ncbi:PREDICTED: agamous-like MADS-box protein AGL80 [Nelumbo nucifera]|uniref:MADS-box domain-containing protein n=2 Tax=Nelumbo nucifera TaxID=4432 RepID=A0A822Z520_NELNU|nr:PREDICTED: agamous-like MADS-box protein AGL80 [Nelumbo nucifera]DAD38479.1 TPA_asm: hypothetical protein HUJ06_009120 [Nelumbo nucifera]